ncbi:protein VAPYRIN-like [Nymphaea colorata]|nr:protein VAPYRIN-like [Nymphaea colorata]
MVGAHCTVLPSKVMSTVKAIALLLEYGMEVNYKDNEGHTLLHCAVEGGSSEVVELLVSNGADVDAITKRGASPLYIAVVMGYFSISKFQLSNGADSSCLASSTSLLSSYAASIPSSSSTLP